MFTPVSNNRLHI